MHLEGYFDISLEFGRRLKADGEVAGLFGGVAPGPRAALELRRADQPRKIAKRESSRPHCSCSREALLPVVYQIRFHFSAPAHDFPVDQQSMTLFGEFPSVHKRVAVLLRVAID